VGVGDAVALRRRRLSGRAVAAVAGLALRGVDDRVAAPLERAAVRAAAVAGHRVAVVAALALLDDAVAAPGPEAHLVDARAAGPGVAARIAVGLAVARGDLRGQHAAIAGGRARLRRGADQLVSARGHVRVETRGRRHDDSGQDRGPHPPTD